MFLKVLLIVAMLSACANADLKLKIRRNLAITHHVAPVAVHHNVGNVHPAAPPPGAAPLVHAVHLPAAAAPLAVHHPVAAGPPVSAHRNGGFKARFSTSFTNYAMGGFKGKHRSYGGGVNLEGMRTMHKRLKSRVSSERENNRRTGGWGKIKLKLPKERRSIERRSTPNAGGADPNPNLPPNSIPMPAASAPLWITPSLRNQIRLDRITWLGGIWDPSQLRRARPWIPYDNTAIQRRKLSQKN